jgi:preprotein translocase subunit SecG
MVFNSFLAAGLIMNILAVLFLISSVALILIVLIQKGRGGGLSSAFAGGMASGILGSKTGDVLTWITIGVVSFYLFIALILDKGWKPTLSSTGRQTAPITTTDTGQPAQPQNEQPAPEQPSPEQSAPVNQPAQQ